MDLIGIRIAKQSVEGRLTLLNDLEKLFEDGKLVNKTFPNGDSSLHIAAAGDHKNLCKQLIKMGADIEAKDVFGRTPLMSADKFRAHKAFKVLIKAGANIQASATHRYNGLIDDLFDDNDFKTINIILKAGVKLDDPLKNGTYPIHHIVNFNDHYNLNVLSNAVLAGMNLEHVNRDGRTPLMMAVEFNDHEQVKILLEAKVNVTTRDRTGNTAITLACKSNSCKVFHLLLKHDTKPFKDPAVAKRAIEGAIKVYVPDYTNTLDELSAFSKYFNLGEAFHYAIKERQELCAGKIIAMGITPISIANYSFAQPPSTLLWHVILAMGITNAEILHWIVYFTRPNTRLFLLEAIDFGFISVKQIEKQLGSSSITFSIVANRPQPTLVQLCQRRNILLELREKILKK